MMPLIVNEQAPVPPPAYHRAQARLGSALHIDALTLVTTLHLLVLCRLAVCLAHRRCPPVRPPCSAVLAARRAPIVRNLSCSSRSCAPCGDSPTRICTTGYAAGLPWLWPADSRLLRTVCLVFPDMWSCQNFNRFRLPQ
jgi:hypothetical protein